MKKYLVLSDSPSHITLRVWVSLPIGSWWAKTRGYWRIVEIDKREASRFRATPLWIATHARNPAYASAVRIISESPIGTLDYPGGDYGYETILEAL